MRSKFGSHLTRLLAGIPRLEGYRNTRPVLNIGGQVLTVEDILRAGIVANIPVLLVSGTGDAKTKLAREIITCWFGGHATILRGDGGEPPIKAFLRVNFERLFQREAKNDEELIEATSRMSWSLVFIDEINRGIIGALQNDMLSVVDGELAYRGRVFRIGDGFLPLWNKLMLDPKDHKLPDEHADDLVAPIAISFEEVRSDLLDVVGGKYGLDHPDLDLREWRPLVATLLDVNRIPVS